ncbi:hypothetical protein D9757_000152 [Collybiopsis confluens]|uniref:Uncharacterized protein n=1 Tax=Collybiopsis confluens TaxID=2823264 RepID=A0A8H5I1Y5_9AGAR|nr:hypothetical protein D9757_000152 [Collybiopsis confluens]
MSHKEFYIILHTIPYVHKVALVALSYMCPSEIEELNVAWSKLVHEEHVKHFTQSVLNNNCKIIFQKDGQSEWWKTTLIVFSPEICSTSLQMSCSSASDAKSYLPRSTAQAVLDLMPQYALISSGTEVDTIERQFPDKVMQSIPAYPPIEETSISSCLRTTLIHFSHSDPREC